MRRTSLPGRDFGRVVGLVDALKIIRRGGLAATGYSSADVLGEARVNVAI
jgi:hypothetical protein